MQRFWDVCIMTFNDTQKLEAWRNAIPVEGYPPEMYRKDICGAWMAWNKYGVQDSPLGWEVDHIFPVALGGNESSQNLCAMQHQNNASKGDDYPTFNAVIKADGNANIRHERTMIINKILRQELQKLYPNA